MSWSIGSGYVGWAPLGRGDRPVYLRSHRVRGYAVPKGALQADGVVPWTYVRRGDIGQRDLAHRRVAASEVPAGELRVAPVGHGRLTRDLRIVQGEKGQPDSAVPRNVRTKPTIGDTVPELRTDPMTTIRRPIPRTHREPDEADDRQPDGGDRARVAVPRAPGAASPWTPNAAVPRQQRSTGEEGGRVGTGHWSDRNEERRRDVQRARPEDGDAARARGRDGDRDRETMRPIFGPLSRPRPDDRGSARDRDGDKGSARGRDSGAAREGGGAGASSAPRPAPPPPANAPSSRGSSKGGGERARPKDHN